MAPLLSRHDQARNTNTNKELARDRSFASFAVWQRMEEEFENALVGFRDEGEAADKSDKLELWGSM